MHLIQSKDSLTNYPSPSSMDSTTENYWRIFDVNLAWIRQSDTKAYTIFMIYGLSISVALSNAQSVAGLVKESNLVLLLSIVYLLASMIAMIFGFRCLQPSLKLKYPPSIIFFGSIARTYTSPEDYYEASLKVINDDEARKRELSNQIFINSVIAKGKFDDITKSITAFLVSLMTLVLIVMNYFI
ncbi:MAG: DUF5706 domain-containing protein [Saprospiraceae bacterium]|nr:DUF5706 domain-containing protein [Saprospiraceae bacterium]